MNDEDEDGEIESIEVTSIDPLNLALTAKSLVSRIWWSFVTFISVVALVCAVGFLVTTYNKRPINVITIVSEKM